MKPGAIPAPPPLASNTRGILKVLTLTFLLNLAVCLAKILVGLSVNALSMVADGIHSLLDASNNVIGFVAMLFASKPADEDHPYGHQKFEVVAALFISAMMGVTCLEILRSAWERWHDAGAHMEPNLLSYGVMAATMGVNAWVSWYEGRKGREYKSPILTADSAHTGSDILASGTVLVALLAARAGHVWVDLAASLLVVVIILRAAYGILSQSLHVLSDHIMLDPGRVVRVVTAVPGIVSCHKVRSRGMPGSIFVDLHIQVSPRLTTLKSHALTHRVMATVKEKVPGVSEVFVHTEPAKPGDYRSGRRRR